MSLEKKLSFWIGNNYNVLFKGRHGVGKTAMIKEAFDIAGLKWMYFSASTMDPWVDFIGVPKEVKDDSGSYLELIRPKQFQNDEVEALFFDEFNRAPKKVRNAVMELIQFKSINGKKFNKLKVVWAAINPDDDDQKYDVEELDPAQVDRFHIIMDIPYLPSANYFRDTYGQDIAESAITWWKELGNDIKKDISPRRLDYALQIYKAGGDIRDVLPAKANINKLMIELETGSISKKLKQLFDEMNAVESKKFLTIENNYSACVDHIVKKPAYVAFFLPVLSDEKVISLIVKHRTVEDHVIANPDKFDSILKEILKANNNHKLVKRIQTVLKPKPLDLRKTFVISTNNPLNTSVKQYSTTTPPTSYGPVLQQAISIAKAHGAYYGQTTQQRERVYQLLVSTIPVTMTIDECNKTLEQLCNIVTHSQISTVKRMANLIPMLNHTIMVLSTYGVAPSFDKRSLRCLTGYSDFIYNIYNQKPVPTPAPAPTPTTAPTTTVDTTFGPRSW